MRDKIDRLIAILNERAKELGQLANDALDLLEIQLSNDIEDCLLHRAGIIASEIALLRNISRADQAFGREVSNHIF